MYNGYFTIVLLCICVSCACNSTGNQNANDSTHVTSTSKDTAAIKAMGKKVFTSRMLPDYVVKVAAVFRSTLERGHQNARTDAQAD